MVIFTSALTRSIFPLPLFAHMHIVLVPTWTSWCLSIRTCQPGPPVVSPYAHRAMFANELRPSSQQPIRMEYVVTTNQFGFFDNVGIDKSDFFQMFEGRTVPELKEHKENYKLKVNPSGEVPSLALPSGDAIVESEIVCEYIDAVSDKPNRLMPEDPLAKSRVQLCMKRFNAVPGAIVGLLKNQDAESDAALVQKLDTVLNKFIVTLDEGSTSGFCIGSSCTLADVHCAPFLYRFGIVLNHYRGYDMLVRQPRLGQVMAAVEAMPEWVQSLGSSGSKDSPKYETATPERLIAMYELYANNNAWIDTPSGRQLAGRGRSAL